MGDHVVIINAEKIHLSGDKMETKLYRHHSGYPGGLKTATAKHVFRKDPTRLLVAAIEGMLPKTPLGNHMAKKLRVYVGATHPHQAQNPEPITLN
jgi:large subunit ribosomal protein L13